MKAAMVWVVVLGVMAGVALAASEAGAAGVKG